jgi:Short C-terminal domain
VEPDPIGQLAQLNELRMAGALTDDEFNAQKHRLLGG